MEKSADGTAATLTLWKRRTYSDSGRSGVGGGEEGLWGGEVALPDTDGRPTTSHVNLNFQVLHTYNCPKSKNLATPHRQLCGGRGGG